MFFSNETLPATTVNALTFRFFAPNAIKIARASSYPGSQSIIISFVLLVFI